VKKLRLQIDISGTAGEAAWRSLNHFPDVWSSRYGPELGSSGPCRHHPHEPHREGEWCGAVLILDDFLAEYALPHYLEQARVLDASIEAGEETAAE